MKNSVRTIILLAVSALAVPKPEPEPEPEPILPLFFLDHLLPNKPQNQNNVIIKSIKTVIKSRTVTKTETVTSTLRARTAYVTVCPTDAVVQVVQERPVPVVPHAAPPVLPAVPVPTGHGVTFNPNTVVVKEIPVLRWDKPRPRRPRPKSKSKYKAYVEDEYHDYYDDEDEGDADHDGGMRHYVPQP